jgi:acetylornithine deacetylase/succinyl-diaminopimelate desuccinylase-like protein
MKDGFAMGLLAVAALRRAMPDAVSGELAFLSVIEEECTGNGTLAACNAGVLGDAVLLLEPTGLDLLLGGVGILWVEIEIEGVPAHAEAADRAVNPVSRVPAILRALADFEAEINAAADDLAFRGPPGPTTSTSARSRPGTGHLACPHGPGWACGSAFPVPGPRTRPLTGCKPPCCGPRPAMASIVRGVRTLAYFIARFFAGGGLPGDPAAAYSGRGHGDD